MIKKIMTYTIPLCIGLIFAVTIFIVQKSGTKSQRNIHINIYPDSLTNHIPRNSEIDEAIFSLIPPSVKQNTGGGGVDIIVDENDKLLSFINERKLDKTKEEINLNEIFNIQVDYRNQVFIQTEFNDSTKYPFPKRFRKENFDKFEILFYDYAKGRFLGKNRLSNNPKLTKEWKHGYSRGIARIEKEYIFWILIW